MPYIEFKSILKKVNLKPNGTKEIVLEVSGTGLDENLNTLAKMIATGIDVSVENQKVQYTVLFDDVMNEPIQRYKVDQSGVVHPVEPTPEQLELEMGLPQENIKTRLEPKELSVDVVNEFVLSGLAPDMFDEFGHDMATIIERNQNGETYMKLATEYGLSSGTIVQMVDAYRIKVAPLAEKWHEWKRMDTMMEKPVDQEEIKEVVEDVEFAPEETTTEEEGQVDEEDLEDDFIVFEEELTDGESQSDGAA